jgi:hypothetical protein
MKTDSAKLQALKAKGLGKKHTPTDNSDFEGKVNLRYGMLSLLGGAANCTVLEAFGGEGHLYDACYTGVKDHIAFELRSIKRPGWIQGDNKILLPKYVAKNGGWNLYDLDAYSNPWPLASMVAKLRPSGVFGMVMTCCVSRTLATANLEPYFRKVSGANNLPDTGLFVRYYDDLIELAVSDWAQYGVTVIDGRRARSKKMGAKTRYYSFLVEKK